jgi:hypothetical protein
MVPHAARLRFGAHDHPPFEWDEPRMPGSAILFFETNDVGAIHAAICARGGKPTGMEKVNGTNMRVFEIRDPDGHSSLHQADPLKTAPSSPAVHNIVKNISPYFSINSPFIRP